MKRTPLIPSLAHHRLMMAFVHMDHKGVEPTPKELDVAGRVFVKAGGSWKALFTGGTDATQLLKKVLSIAVKKDIFTKKSKW